MTRAMQAQKALQHKLKAERRLGLWLNPWIEDISVHYRIGDSEVHQESITILEKIFKRFYYITVRDILGFDLREFKAKDKTLIYKIMDAISLQLSRVLKYGIDDTVRSITRTANDFVRRTTREAIEPRPVKSRVTEIESRRTLVNYLKNHKATIQITQSQWVVETTRMTVAKTIDKTLKIFALEVADLAESGLLAEANKVASQGLALEDFPLTTKQESLLNVVMDNTKKVVDPLSGDEVGETIRDQADELGKDIKVWTTVGDGKVRPSHQAADGQERPIDDPYDLEGGQVRYPGDGSMGVDLSEIVNCIIEGTEIEIDSKIKKIYRRNYSGEVIKINITGGMNVTVTPNHPILTNRGWKEAKFLDHNDKVGCLGGVDKFIKIFFGTEPQKENMPSIIEKIYNFAFIKYNSSRIRGSYDQFHGDGTNSDINVIFINGFFENWIKSIFREHVGKFFISITNFCKMFLVSLCTVNKNFSTPFISTNSGMCFFGKSFSFGNGSMLHSHKHRFASISGFETDFSKMPIDAISINHEFFGYSFDGHPSIVEFNEIIDIERMYYSGHVYNLQTKNNYYMAGYNIKKNNGNVKKIIVHNCRCSSVFV